MLRAMGSEAAVPSEADVIDMIEVLTELTNPACEQEGRESDYTMTFNGFKHSLLMIQSWLIFFTGAQVFSSRQHNHNLQIVSHKAEPTSHAVAFHPVKVEPRQFAASGADQKHFTDAVPEAKKTNAGLVSSPEEKDVRSLLHSGPMLGDLPQLSPSKGSPNGKQQLSAGPDLDKALELDRFRAFGGGMLSKVPVGRAAAQHRLSRKSDSKDKKKKDTVPKDMPIEFICELTHRPMSEPVRTIYGNVYDKIAIANWLTTQGKICPLTGE